MFQSEENLLSLGALKAQGCKFTYGALKVTKGSMTVLKAECMVNLYKVIGSVVIGNASVATEKEDTTRLWLMRLRHMSERGLQALHNKGGLSGIKHCKLNLRKFCITSGQSRIAFTISVHKSKGLLDLVHTDVWRPSLVASVGGACCYVTCINNFSRKV